MSNLLSRGRVRERRKAVIAVAVGVLVAGGLSAFLTQGFADAANSPPWLDANKPVSARVNALLGAMTLPEKVGQMDQQLVDDVTGPSNACGSQGFAQPNPTCMKTVLVDNYTGSVLAGGTDNPPDTTGQGGTGNTGFDWANEYNMIQKYAVENSRLHIPLIFGVDAVHGFGHPWQAPLYPQSIGMGATWDPSAAQAGGAATADALRATGWVWDFAPVQDLSRDNRWGRTYETWAEEPVLSAAMGGANVRGLQTPGPNNSQDVQALQTAYHIAANRAEAIAKAVNAGVDMAMYVTDSAQWQAAILQDVQSNAIPMARINEAVRRILTLKFELGLFDQPCVTDPNTPCVDANAANAAVTAGRDSTLKAAQESMTLLRNQNNTLPLSASANVVVTGPSADSMTNQLGGWSVSWQGVFGAGHVCCMGPPNQIPPGTTVLKGLQAEDSNVVSAPDQATAVKDAASADAVVVAVGEKAYAEGLGDNPAPQLPQRS